MQFLKRNLTQIRANMAGASFATKWLIGALVVIMLLVGYMLVWWGGSADMVPVDGVAAGSPGEVVTVLQADGIDAELINGKVMVPVGQRHEAVGSLSRSGHLNPNASAAFDQLIADDSGSMFLSSVEKDRKYLAAKGHFLSAVIQSFPNVESASVILDKPQANGFGAVSHIESSASVMVTMRPGSKVTQQMANTLIHMVSSSVAGLHEQNVTVSDTLNNRSFAAANEEDAGAVANVEMTLQQERIHKQKIEDVLRPWDGALIAVKIVTSHVLREEVRETQYQEKDQLVRSETEELETKDYANGGEPGPGANIRSSIDGSGGTGTQTTENRTFNEFGPKQPTRQSTRRISGNAIRQINVSVAVPRSYFVRIFRAQNPEAEAPSDDQLKPIFDAEQQKIKDLVGLQTVSSEADMQQGAISVQMVYDQAYLEPATAGVGGGLGAVMSSDLTQNGILAGLAVMALALAFYMVRRATRPDDLPTVEELAGVPPALPTDDDLMGEVDEMDGGLAGVELDEDELRARQIADQISDLVRANPEEASGLLTKWVAEDQN